METLSFEELIQTDIQKTKDWLIKEGISTQEGRLYHSLFFKTEKDAKEALMTLLRQGYQDSHIDMIEDDEFLFWIDVVKHLPLTEEKIQEDIEHVVSLLNRFDFLYNKFSVLIDKNDETSLLFSPAEA